MRVMRFEEVAKCVGLSRTTIWRLERTAKFPKRVRVGAGGVGWIEEEVLAWIAELPRGMAALAHGHKAKS